MSRARQRAIAVLVVVTLIVLEAVQRRWLNVAVMTDAAVIGAVIWTTQARRELSGR